MGKPDNRVVLPARVAPPLRRRFAAACKRERRSMNDQLVVLIEGWLDDVEASLSRRKA